MTGCEVCGRAFLADCPHHASEPRATGPVEPDLRGGLSKLVGNLAAGDLQWLLHEVVLELERRGYVCNYGVGGPVR